jgi:(p)ppGpp synthase/HD superfamily hydrolase
MTTEVLADVQPQYQPLTMAFELALKVHQNQYRKSTTIPYISHLMSVAALVFENGGTVNQAIAGLLHDALEDADPPSITPHLKDTIATSFGSEVLKIVEACTDGIQDEFGDKGPWLQRKQAYLEKLSNKAPKVLLVSCCDKLHNARAILTDLNTIGPMVFERFSANKEQTLWYYESLANIFSESLMGHPGEIAATTLVETLRDIKDKVDSTK